MLLALWLWALQEATIRPILSTTALSLRVFKVADQPFMSSLYDQYSHEGDESSVKRDALLKQMKGKGSITGPSLAAAAGDAADIISTQYALSKGGHEANPMLPNDRFANAATLTGEAALFQYLLHKFGPDHPTLAKIFGYGRAGVGAYSALHNIRSGQQSGR